jgi:hypothetical protein
MRDSLADRFLRAIGIAQGAYFLWFTLGGGVVVVGVAAGLLAAYSTMPGWSIAVICAGLFIVGAGMSNYLVTTIARRVTPRSEAYHALTTVIESGRRLRQRYSELDADPDPDEDAKWEFRFRTWEEDAADVVRRVAPFRLAAFQVDPVVVGYPGTRTGRPSRIARWELNVETTLERLLYIRATL